MPKINQEVRQTIVKNAVSIITLTDDEVTEIVTKHLQQHGYSLIDGTVTPSAGYEYRGNPDWGIPDRPVGVFLGYRAEVEMVQENAPTGAESEEEHA